MPPETKPEPKKIREVTLTLARRIRETPDTATLVLDRPADAPSYLAGQFLTLDPRQFLAVRPWAAYLEHAKQRRELVRAYSLSSAPHETELAFTVKEEPYLAGTHPYPPLLSPYLVHGISPGTPLKATCFTGPYILPPDIESRTDHVVHLVAGSGSVPNFSILKESLHTHRRLRHTFLYSNKTWEDICFREPLAALEKAHPTQLTVVHFLTREPDATRFHPDAAGTTAGGPSPAPRVRSGRITLETLREWVPEPARAFVYLCGPAITPPARRAALEAGVPATPRFLEHALDLLEQLGVPKAQVKREAYG